MIHQRGGRSSLLSDVWRGLSRTARGLSVASLSPGDDGGGCVVGVRGWVCGE